MEGLVIDIVKAPQPPKVRVNIGVTGHRASHPSYQGSGEAIQAAIAAIFEQIEQAQSDVPLLLGPDSLKPTRLHTLLMDGVDQTAALLALDRGWELISPLPFGRNLNLAINAVPKNAADAHRLLAGKPAEDKATQIRAEAIEEVAQKAKLFELADQDEVISDLYFAALDAPDDFAKAQIFAAESAERARLAGRIIIEQSDLIIAVWDGASKANIGGTGHTVAMALDQGAPVIWINPANPANWQILYAPESLASLKDEIAQDGYNPELAAIVREVICPREAMESDHSPAHRGLGALGKEKWRNHSSRFNHAYRRIEALFSGEPSRFRRLVQTYEKPQDIKRGSAADLLKAAADLPGRDNSLADMIDASALQRFAWADGISARLSDQYRSAMALNFILSAFAVVGGVLYLPLVAPEQKWGFALFEFVLLLLIVINTYRGQKHRWHGRWFEIRRIAEYFRHSPLMVIIGVARAPGLWPRGTQTSWPEWYVRQGLREIGLPRAKLTPSYLRSALSMLLDHHIIPQREYHLMKSKRLKSVDHKLDRLSESLFKLAILFVGIYLVLKGGAVLNILDPEAVNSLSKIFTVLAVFFPTFGGAIAGIRFFGDFDRFAAISAITAEKLSAIDGRIRLLLSAPDQALNYGEVSELVHTTDNIVIAEIENWQAVFGGKNITVPV